MSKIYFRIIGPLIQEETQSSKIVRNFRQKMKFLPKAYEIPMLIFIKKIVT